MVDDPMLVCLVAGLDIGVGEIPVFDVPMLVCSIAVDEVGAGFVLGGLFG